MHRIPALACLLLAFVGSSAFASAVPAPSRNASTAAAFLPADLAPDPAAVALAAESYGTPVAITATAGDHGIIAPSGTVMVAPGTDQTFTMTPDDCYYIEQVLVNGLPVAEYPTYTFTNVQEPATIAVSFAIAMETIDARAMPGGRMTPRGFVSVPCGSDRSFVFQPDPCYHVLDVVVDGVSLGPLAGYTFTNVRANHTITVTFALDGPYTLHASAGPNGTIAPSGDVIASCGATQTFTITPETCYHVQDVLVDGLSKGAITSYTFTGVQASHTIAASFALNQPPTIYALEGSPGGLIFPSGSVPVPCGGDQTFTIAAAPCYHIVNVTVDGVWVGPVSSYTFYDVVGPHSINPYFGADHVIYGVQPVFCPPDQGTATVFGMLDPNTTYSVDVREASCPYAPVLGLPLAHSGTVTTDGTGQIVATNIGCYPPHRTYGLIVDALSNGVYAPGCDPVACFTVDVPEPVTGIEDIQATIEPEGPTLSWRVTDLGAYQGFRIHRAPEGGAEVLVTPQPLAVPTGSAPATMRWCDAAAVPGTRYTYRIEALTASGSDWYGPVTLAVPRVPMELALRGATPNPFQAATQLALDVPFGAGAVRLDVFDVAGRRVRALVRGTLAPGEPSVTWNGRDDAGVPVCGGVYLVRLEGARLTRTLRVVKMD